MTARTDRPTPGPWLVLVDGGPGVLDSPRITDSWEQVVAWEAECDDATAGNCRLLVVPISEIASAPALLAERNALREQVKTLREGAQAACQFLIRTNLCPSDTLSALAELRAALASTEAEVKP